jgi:TAFII55 protein conserved region
MKEVEEDATATLGPVGGPNTPSSTTSIHNNSNNNKETLLDLEGVMCEPTQDGSTLWNFHCDGATYPARLVNLPCPVEIHKTHDHAMYYKSCDIAQMLIVYEDSMALDEADACPRTDGYPSYYHSVSGIIRWCRSYTYIYFSLAHLIFLVFVSGSHSTNETCGRTTICHARASTPSPTPKRSLGRRTGYSRAHGQDIQGGRRKGQQTQ